MNNMESTQSAWMTLREQINFMCETAPCSLFLPSTGEMYHANTLGTP